jgi:serine/threonine-protein phosphatase 2B catalytic subunit
MKGFKYQYGSNNQPLTLTIFSAPRYCDTYNNKAAVAILNGKDLAIKSFKDSEHPFVLNNYLNAFDLSFPVIGMGVSKIFTHILKNPKVRKSLKITNEELELIELLKKIDTMDEIMKMLNINVNQISLLFSAAHLKSTTEAQDIGENLLEFIEDTCL